MHRKSLARAGSFLSCRITGQTQTPRSYKADSCLHCTSIQPSEYRSSSTGGSPPPPVYPPEAQQYSFRRNSDPATGDRVGEPGSNAALGISSQTTYNTQTGMARILPESLTN